MSTTTEQNIINEVSQYIPGISMLPVMNTFAEVSAQFDVWSQFDATDVAGLPSNITINGSTSTFNNGVLIVNYSIGTKTGIAYAWARNFGKTADGPTALSEFGSNGKAILICPGSGNNANSPGGVNETINMMAGAGYEANALFPIGCAIGDAYVYSPPGSDLQSLIGPNGNNILEETIYDAIAVRGSNAAILSQVQTAVIMQFLKTANTLNSLWPSYSKFGVMGLSKGAYLAAMTGLINEPQAVVVASGFSLKEFRSLGFSLMGGNDSIPVYTATTLTAAIKASSSKFLFTASTVQPEIAFMTAEAADHETATALANPNVTSLFHTQGHSYPSPDTYNFLLENM